MKKLFLLLLISFLVLPAFAQNDQIAPTLTKSELISFLQDNYSVTDSKSYNQARDAMFEDIDGKSGEITCVYTGYTISFTDRIDAQGSQSAGDFNTEHSWPQSFFDQDSPMRSDIHHLFPTRVDVNGARNNFEFDEIPDEQTDKWYREGINQTSIPNEDIDEYSELDGERFEPREDHKGNVARAMFYFWSIYQDNNSITSDVTDNEAFFNGMRDVLLTWHDLDPVDSLEISRSMEIETVQGNRNPFVHDTTLVRRAFFDGVIAQPDSVPNPVTGKITSIEETTFDLTYTNEDKERTVEFSYANSFSAKDTADMDFNLTEYETILEAEVVWEQGASDSELIATSLTVIDFGSTDPDTVITGPTASVRALLITGVVDADLTGGTPKAVELYATENIPDLGVFGLGSANNGGGTEGVEFNLSGSVAKGEYIYISIESASFNAFFGFDPDLVNDSNSSAVAINGNDAVELFYDSTKVFEGSEIVVDTFGELNVDGTGEAWEYTDGWAYRKDFTGPDSISFNINNWNFSGPTALEDESTNASASTPFPTGSYIYEVGTANEESTDLKVGFNLYQNYPNPFNPSTIVSFGIPESGFVSLKVYDLVGREVATLVNEEKPAGTYQVVFDANGLSSGVYIYRVETGGRSLTNKMLLIK